MNHEFESLKMLVPACQQSISNGNGNNNSGNGGSGSNGGLHKLVILQETVEYIRYLKKCMETMETRHKEMQGHVTRLQQQVNNLMVHSEGNVNQVDSVGGHGIGNGVVNSNNNNHEDSAIDPNLMNESKDRSLSQPSIPYYPNLHPQFQTLQQEEPHSQTQHHTQHRSHSHSHSNGHTPKLQVDIHDETTAAAVAALVDLDKMVRKSSFSSPVLNSTIGSNSSNGSNSGVNASASNGSGSIGKPLQTQLPIISVNPKTPPPNSGLVSRVNSQVNSQVNSRTNSQTNLTESFKETNEIEPSPRIRVSDLIC